MIKLSVAFIGICVLPFTPAYRNGSFIHGTIFSQISQKVAFRENIIVNVHKNRHNYV